FRVRTAHSTLAGFSGLTAPSSVLLPPIRCVTRAPQALLPAGGLLMPAGGLLTPAGGLFTPTNELFLPTG
ncbi:MAG: hypothetical protein ACREXU_17245, partial [Gammaproteobacteria bacterium]